jgi:UDP-glucuronate 4-epimerase
MTVLVTGAAGFIGLHVALALLDRGERVVGVDDLNAYYDPSLKHARLNLLQRHERFSFARLDIAERAAVDALVAELGGAVTGIVHLAAQAGVRWSLVRPFDYVRSNIEGHLVILEAARRLPALRHLVYASSSSVYGANERLPFSVEDRVDRPESLYAATKRADELLSLTYARLYGLPQTGLRFFTVYGPWGRPDMAYYAFADALAAGRPLTLHNEGRMRRDFTFVDDVVQGVLAALDRPPGGSPPHRIYNLGSADPVEVKDLVAVLERLLGVTAELRLGPMQPGDVVATAADITATTRDLGWAPATGLEAGLAAFVSWHRAWHAPR